MLEMIFLLILFMEASDFKSPNLNSNLYIYFSTTWHNCNFGAILPQFIYYYTSIYERQNN